jgi:hypothetical protein
LLEGVISRQNDKNSRRDGPSSIYKPIEDYITNHTTNNSDQLQCRINEFLVQSSSTTMKQ